MNSIGRRFNAILAALILLAQAASFSLHVQRDADRVTAISKAELVHLFQGHDHRERLAGAAERIPSHDEHCSLCLQRAAGKSLGTHLSGVVVPFSVTKSFDPVPPEISSRLVLLGSVAPRAPPRV